MDITYSHSDSADADYRALLLKLITDLGAKRICELGGGANPALESAFIQERGISYTILDISPEELAKAPEGYETKVADVSAERPPCEGEFDLVFSHMLAEHVKNGPQLHKNVFAMLRPGGKALHYFPTLYSLPMLANRLLPERIGSMILAFVQPGREAHGKNAKFPAYYTWCRGPMKRQIRRFESLGFTIKSYRGFFGHAEYYQKFPAMQRINHEVSRWLLRHPIPWLTTKAFLLLEKPAEHFSETQS